jgi:ectoine hydroxylase-related dioxygenase (phytanoyl-CoA dioxygenase family)
MPYGLSNGVSTDFVCPSELKISWKGLDELPGFQPNTQISLELGPQGHRVCSVEGRHRTLISVHSDQLTCRAIRTTNNIGIFVCLGTQRSNSIGPLAIVELVSPLPAATTDVGQAKADLETHGMCVLADVLGVSELDELRTRLKQQAAAERALGDLAPKGMVGDKQFVPNMVNKGQPFLDLVDRAETDELVGHLLGKHFLLSSINGHIFLGSTDEPQTLHRDQGQVPASIEIPVVCNLLWVLDDFVPEAGSTLVVPGSHRWAPEHQVKPPDPGLAVPVTAPAGSVLALDGRIWHGSGINTNGATRRSIATFFCAPWIRQQENAGVSCLQEVIDDASPRLRERLGMRTYGTMGTVGGTGSAVPGASLTSDEFDFPEYIIGERGSLHPLRRVSRQE